MRVHPDQHVLFTRHMAMNQDKMRFRSNFAGIEHGSKLSRRRRDAPFTAAVNILFIAQAVADEIGHRDHLEIVFRAKFAQLRHARHGAVFVHNFADHAGGVESRQAGKVDRCLGLPGANEHAAIAGAQRKNVARAGEIAWGCRGMDSGQDGPGAVRRRDAGCNAVAGIYGFAERRSKV